MIAHLSGTVIDFIADAVVLNVNGVGYLVHVPTSLKDDLSIDEEAKLSICTVVREDAITLFGFENSSQRETFETLRSVNKVGPKLAMGILSHIAIDDLARAVQHNDAVALSKIPGIGKKTAERLCLELKNKLSTPVTKTGQTILSSRRKTTADPLQLALAQLDYRKSEIDLVLSAETVPSQEEAPIEQRLRAALAFLANPG